MTSPNTEPLLRLIELAEELQESLDVPGNYKLTDEERFIVAAGGAALRSLLNKPEASAEIQMPPIRTLLDSRLRKALVDFIGYMRYRAVGMSMPREIADRLSLILEQHPMSVAESSAAAELQAPLPSDKLMGLVRKWREEKPVAYMHYVMEVEALLSQEPGEAQKPVAWRAWHKFSESRGYCWVYWDEYPETIKDDPEFSQFQALFASPVTDGGGDAEAAARDYVEQFVCNPRAENYDGEVARLQAIIRRHMQQSGGEK